MATHPMPDVWDAGAAYERFIGRWSRKVAPQFLEWLDVPPGRRWLDVGCGTGALCASILDRRRPAHVIGVEPSAGYLTIARGGLPAQAELRHGSATSLPLDDGTVDVVVSALVLNFVADAPVAVREMSRVLTPGGTVAAYVWDYAEGMQLLRHFWDVAAEVDPRGAALDEGVRFPVCRPGALAQLFADAGLGQVDVAALEVETPFTDFDDYWQPFLGGQGPAPTYLMSLDEDTRSRVRDQVRGRLPFAADGSIPLTARAWAVRGTGGARQLA